MKIRVKFRKYGAMKFIGHLDIMRYFQKAVRRAGIDICYTEGFSPHQVMSFAAPLGVGITSDGEYMDIEVHATKPSRQSVSDFNAVMCEGIEVTGYVQLDGNAKPAMSAVSAADYEIWYRPGSAIPPLCLDPRKLQQALEAFFVTPEEVLVTKKTKKSEKILDLKKLVYDFQILAPQERFFSCPAFYMKLSTGSTDNIKPELVLETFYGYAGVPYEPFAMQIHRKDLYFTDKDGHLQPLLEAGHEIG